MLKRLLFFILTLAVSIAAFAGLDELPIKMVGNRYCYVYKVKGRNATVQSVAEELGVSQTQLLLHNPDLSSGQIKSNTEIVLPCSEFVPQNYVVRKKDTAYSLSRIFGISLERFYELNPEARDGVIEGKTVKLGGKATERKSPASQVASTAVSTLGGNMATSVINNDDNKKYTIAQGETLYSIARKHGISLTQLLSVNPDLDVANYPAGTVINIPELSASQDEATNSTVPMPSEVFQGAAIHEDEFTKMNDTLANGGYSDVITIAVGLPFMADASDRSRQSVLFTEFYRGLLMAVDSMRNNSKPIKLICYDTKGTDEGVETMLADPALRSAQLILAPENQKHLAMVGDYGRDNGINILNLFVVKDNSYMINPRMMHSNIPHIDMYNRAVDYLMRSFDGAIPVVLMRKDGLDDKGEFVGMLKSRSLHLGRDVVTIEYDNELSLDDLQQLDKSKQYAFVPISSKLGELNKVTDALLEYEKSLPLSTGNMLWGYPEWLSFRGETLAAMNQLNTYIFSRFFTSPTDDIDSQRVKDAYVRWYGKQVSSVIPNQALYGFDAGMYIITALTANGGDFDAYTPLYDGVQNCFNFNHENDVKGWINNEMFFIHYTPSGMVNKITL